MNIWSNGFRLRVSWLSSLVVAPLIVFALGTTCHAQSASYLCAKGKTIIVRAQCLRGEKKISSLEALNKKIGATELASGSTITGIFGSFLAQAATDDLSYSAASFPLRPPVDVSDGDVVVKTDERSDNECEGQPCADPLFDSVSSLCTGSAANPTAPTGKLCIYLSYCQNVRARSVAAVMVGGRDPSTGDHLSRQGFQVYGITGPSGVGFNLNGTWAYTAP
jgi:hypothetical protein